MVVISIRGSSHRTKLISAELSLGDNLVTQVQLKIRA